MAGGATSDPLWIQNELDMLEKTLVMYQVYAAKAAKQDKKAWEQRLHELEERINETKKKLEKASKR